MAGRSPATRRFHEALDVRAFSTTSCHQLPSRHRGPHAAASAVGNAITQVYCGCKPSACHGSTGRPTRKQITRKTGRVAASERPVRDETPRPPTLRQCCAMLCNGCTHCIASKSAQTDSSSVFTTEGGYNPAFRGPFLLELACSTCRSSLIPTSAETLCAKPSAMVLPAATRARYPCQPPKPKRVAGQRSMSSL